MGKKRPSSCSDHQDGLMNKGAWNPLEDKLLISYIKAHGEGKWRSLPKKAGLKRCGKSCRLRWLNYLRPDIKRGNITQDEEELIIRLHKLLGNKWSLIAGRLPGRTDNEIKNYWNTTLAKKLNAGPPESSIGGRPICQSKEKSIEIGRPAPSVPKVQITNVIQTQPLRYCTRPAVPVQLPLDKFFSLEYMISNQAMEMQPQLGSTPDQLSDDDGAHKKFSYDFMMDYYYNTGEEEEEQEQEHEQEGYHHVACTRPSSSNYFPDVQEENGCDDVSPNIDSAVESLSYFLDLEEEWCL